MLRSGTSYWWCVEPAGSSATKHAPPRGLSSLWPRPWWRETMARTTASPRPLPHWARVRLSSRRVKRSKTRSR